MLKNNTHLGLILVAFERLHRGRDLCDEAVAGTGTALPWGLSAYGQRIRYRKKQDGCEQKVCPRSLAHPAFAAHENQISFPVVALPPATTTSKH
jgi:hypothetical protein